MEGRKQFTFYQSYAEAVARIRKKADRADAYDAIVNYALYGVEPDLERLSDSAAIAFSLIRPVLDTGRKKAQRKWKDNEKKKEKSGEEGGNEGE